jgi:lipase maturation factor 1
MWHSIKYSANDRLWDQADTMGRPLTTVLWLAKDRTHLNPRLDGIAVLVIVSSVAMLVTRAANVPLLLIPYIVCQRSLMAVGSPWYGYGREPQLAGLGFQAIFLVPLLSPV